MSYTKTTWKTGDVITARRLFTMSYEKTVWNKGDIITAEKLNKIENAIELINSGLD